MGAVSHVTHVCLTNQRRNLLNHDNQCHCRGGGGPSFYEEFEKFGLVAVCYTMASGHVTELAAVVRFRFNTYCLVVGDACPSSPLIAREQKQPHLPPRRHRRTKTQGCEAHRAPRDLRPPSAPRPGAQDDALERRANNVLARKGRRSAEQASRKTARMGSSIYLPPPYYFSPAVVLKRTIIIQKKREG